MVLTNDFTCLVWSSSLILDIKVSVRICKASDRYCSDQQHDKILYHIHAHDEGSNHEFNVLSKKNLMGYSPEGKKSHKESN